MFEMKTIVFSYVITNTLIMLFIALLWHQNRQRYAGLGLWLVDYVLQAVGILLVMLRGIAPDLGSIVIGNASIQIGALCIFIGLERFVGKPSSQTHNWIGIVGFVGLMAYFTFIQPDISIRTIVISAATILLTGQSAWLLLRRVDLSLRPITRQVGIVFLLYVLVALARIVELILLPLPATSSFFESPPIQALFILINQILCIALTFALILMVTRRLEQDVQAQTTERRHAEQVLGESERRFALAFRSSPYAIMITRALDGKIIEVNEGFTQIAGYSAAECIGKTTLELNLWVDQHDRARFVAEFGKGAPVAAREFRFRKKDGSILFGLISASIFTSGGQTCILSSISDITERKRAEQLLRENEERFRTVANFTYDWEYWVSPEGRHIYVSPACERITGYRAEEFMREPNLLRTLIHPDDRALLNSHLHDGFEKSETAAVDFRIITRGGAERWLNHVCVPVYGDDGRWLGRRASNRDITARKETEARINKLAERLDLATRAAHLGIWDWDIQKNVLVWDDRMYELYGIKKEDFPGAYEAWLNGVHPDDRAPSNEISEQARRGERAYDTEFRVVWPNGTVRVIKANGQVIWDADGKPLRMTGINSDITERKRAEDALRASEERYRSLFENMLEGYAYCQMLFEQGQPYDFVYLDVNPAFEMLTGLKNVVGQKVSQVVPGIRTTNPELFEIYGRVASTGQPEKFETYLPALGIWFSVSVYSPAREHFVAVFDNITERKRAQQEIERLASFPRLNPNPVLEVDATGTITYQNDAASALASRTQQDVRALLPPDLPEILQTFAAKQSQMLYREVEIDGLVLGENIYYVPQFDVARIYTIDITERKHAEERLRENETLLRTIADNYPNSYLSIIERDLTIGFTSGQEFKNQHLDPNQFVGLALEQVFGDQTPTVREHYLKTFEGQEQSFELFINNQHQLYRAVPLRAPDGTIPRILSVVENITERKRAQAALQEYSTRLEQMVEDRARELRDAHEQLVRQERLAMLGQLAGGIGHELRSPLGAIKNAVYLLNLSLKTPDPDIQETMDILKRQVDASDRVITSLLDFARPKPPYRRKTNLRELIDAALAQVVLPNHIAVQQQFDAALPVLSVDPAQLQIVFGNLIRNAAQAMPDGGTLTIAARDDADQVAISFGDTGVGIAPEIMDKIFQPMFTTRTRGMGLGLALCKLLVEGHNGKIEVTSQVGRGTTFIVSLPISS